MISSETLDKVVEELFELKDGTEDIDPEAVCSELFDPDVWVDGDGGLRSKTTVSSLAQTP